MTFTLDNRNSSTLTADTRSSTGTFTNDSQSGLRVTWGSEVLTWAQETHSWAELISSFSQDTRH